MQTKRNIQHGSINGFLSIAFHHTWPLLSWPLKTNGFLSTMDLTFKPSSKHKLNLKKEDADAAQVPSANRQPKTYSYGLNPRG